MLRLKRTAETHDAQIVSRAKPPSGAAGKWCYAGNVAHLAAVQRQRVVLGGELVVVTLDETLDPGPGFVRQRPRRAHHWLAPGAGTQLHVWVRSEVLARKDLKAELLVDHYLARILASTASGIYLGAVDAGDCTIAMAFVYERRRIVLVNEYRNLAAVSAPQRLAAELAGIVGDLTRAHPGLPVTTFAPLPEALDLGRHVPEAPLFGRQRRARMRTSTKRAPRLAAWMLATAVAFGGVGFYVQAYLRGHGALAAARAEFEQVRKGLPGQAQWAPLQLLEAQRAFLGALQAEELAAAGMGPLLRQLAQEPALRIESLTRYFLPGDAASGVEFTATVVVPAEPGLAALTQGRALLSRLAANTGHELRLNPQGWSERSETVRGKTLQVRVYTFSGVLQSANPAQR